MKEIPLTRGYSAIVDDADFEEISAHGWYCSTGGYAVRQGGRQNGKQSTIYMHVQIFGDIDGLEVDHINGNTLDNRRSNLRRVTHQQNCQNTSARRGKASSVYRGVSWHAKNKKWIAQIWTNRIKTYLGLYASEEDAALAYNVAAKEMFGEYARLNVIEK